MRRTVLLFSIIFMTIVSYSSKIIHVGGYNFPPFVVIENRKVSGLTIDMIELFNKVQSDYIFKFIKTTPTERYRDFENNIFDCMFFEAEIWGWEGYNVVSSNVYLNGGEIYIASKIEGVDQNYFKEISNKKISCIKGYHYKFASYNSNEKYLHENFDIILNDDHYKNIENTLNGYSDISIVTKSFLLNYIKRKPENSKKIYISFRLDQKYKHTILLNKNSDISIFEINLFLKKIFENRSFPRLLEKYGLEYEY